MLSHALDASGQKCHDHKFDSILEVDEKLQAWPCPPRYRQPDSTKMSSPDSPRRSRTLSPPPPEKRIPMQWLKSDQAKPQIGLRAERPAIVGGSLIKELFA